jgi:peroxiredoxin
VIIPVGIIDRRAQVLQLIAESPRHPTIKLRPIDAMINKPINRLSGAATNRFSALVGLSTIAIIALSVVPLGYAGQYNAVLDIGDEAPQWKELEGVDGKRHSWTQVADARCVVVAFTCNSCPYARDVEDRLIALTNEFPADDVRLIAINVNLVDDDLLPAMKARAEEKGYTFAYLHDPTQQIAKAYGAIKTPEFFVLDGAGKVAYMGALDDSPDGKSVKERFVADAIKGVLAGQLPTVTETVPIGCRVRYSRENR